MCSSGLLKFFAVVGTSNAYFHQEHNLISFRGVRKKVRRTESAHLCSPPPSPVHNVALNSKPGIAARSGSFLQGQKHSRSHNIGFWGYGGYASIDTSMVARTFFRKPRTSKQWCWGNSYAVFMFGTLWHRPLPLLIASGYHVILGGDLQDWVL